MRLYNVSNSANIKSTVTISYTCENCGKETSYTRPFWRMFSETLQGSNPQKLKEEVTKKVYKQAAKVKDDILSNKYTWEYIKTYYVSSGPALHKGYQACPNCGYLQSWMEDIERGKWIRNYVTIPTYGVTIILGWILWKVSDVPNPNVTNTWLTIGFWVVSLFAVRRLGLKLVNSIDPNKKFGEVETTCVPTLTWSTPIIT